MRRFVNVRTGAEVWTDVAIAGEDWREDTAVKLDNRPAGKGKKGRKGGKKKTDESNQDTTPENDQDTTPEDDMDEEDEEE